MPTADEGAAGESSRELAETINRTGEEVVAEEKASAFTVGASYFTRYELREGYDSLGRVGGRFGEGDGTAYRARVSLETAALPTEAGPTVSLRFVPQASGFWGDVSGGLADANLGLHEADLRIIDHHWSLQIGRFEMAYGDHLVIGTVDWHETGRAFDGARVHVPLATESAYLDIFATQVAEGVGRLAPAPSAAFADGDSYFVGVYAGLGPMLSKGLDLDTYLFSSIVPRAYGDSEPAIQWTLGTRAKKQLDQLWVRGELGLQLGKREAVDAQVVAYQADAEVGSKLGEAGSLALAGLVASGDDASTETNEAWDQLYPTAHKFLGLMDIIGGRSNVASANLKGRWKVRTDVVAAADAHMFWRLEAPGADSFTAVEADLWMLYKLGGGLGLRGQYSMLFPSEEGAYGSDYLVHYGEVQLRFDI